MARDPHPKGVDAWITEAMIGDLAHMIYARVRNDAHGMRAPVS